MTKGWRNAAESDRHRNRILGGIEKLKGIDVTIGVASGSISLHGSTSFFLAIFVPLFFQRLYELGRAPACSALHSKEKLHGSFTVEPALQDATP
jgi:hypothetical protein